MVEVYVERRSGVGSTRVGEAGVTA